MNKKYTVRTVQIKETTERDLQKCREYISALRGYMPRYSDTVSEALSIFSKHLRDKIKEKGGEEKQAFLEAWKDG